jgi:hypothetical protein
VNPHEGWQWKSFYVVQRNKDCNVQPDAAATEWKLGHVKKSLMMTQKDWYIYVIKKITRFPSSLSSFSMASL